MPTVEKQNLWYITYPRHFGNANRDVVILGRAQCFVKPANVVEYTTSDQRVVRHQKITVGEDPCGIRVFPMITTVHAPFALANFRHLVTITIDQPNLGMSFKITHLQRELLRCPPVIAIEDRDVLAFTAGQPEIYRRRLSTVLTVRVSQYLELISIRFEDLS